MAYPNLTPLPTPPNPDAPATFDTLAYPFTQAQVTLAAEINALVAQLNATFFPSTPMLATINGTAAAPVYSWQGDTNTGMYRAGADVLAFATAGVERLRITATGLLQSSTAIVTSTTDTTAGRLLTTGAGPAQAFRRGNILGTVSQSGGVPTGAVIERGSNANGQFVKFADGTQICWGTAVDGGGTTEAVGALWRSARIDIPLPSAMVQGSYVVSGSVDKFNRWATFYGYTAGNMIYARTLQTSEDAVTATVLWTAIGRWF